MIKPDSAIDTRKFEELLEDKKLYPGMPQCVECLFAWSDEEYWNGQKTCPECGSDNICTQSSQLYEWRSNKQKKATGDLFEVRHA